MLVSYFISINGIAIFSDSLTTMQNYFGEIIIIYLIIKCLVTQFEAEMKEKLKIYEEIYIYIYLLINFMYIYVYIISKL